jgi:AraC family transcriptional activator of tynA and feaB
MVASRIVGVEVERPRGRLRAWEDALSTDIDPVVREQVAVHCLSMDERRFMGRIESGALGEMRLSKVASTNFRFTRSMTGTKPTPTLPILARLVLVSRGSYTFVQRGRTCTLTPGDWALIDAGQPHAFATSPKVEAFAIMLPRTSDAEMLALFEDGVARRWSGTTGLSRVLHAMVNESFSEMRRLPIFGGRKLGAAIAAMAWDALREQIETPPAIGYRDERSIRVKAYIESHLADPELSVERIARACNISVRGLHRLFAEDPTGSVSSYLWWRRLIRCADTLRDPSQAHRSIIDVCFSYGFSSSSHFSRLFKDRFGVPPTRYRAGLASPLRVIPDQS